MTRVAALGAAASALLAARACLALAPGRTVRIVVRVNAPRDSRHGNAARLRDLCWAVTAIGARPPFSATCLEQAVALVMLLRIVRIPATVVIGVTRAEPALRAHAWVESGGLVVLGGAQAQGLVPLVRMSRTTTLSPPPSAVSASCPG